VDEERESVASMACSLGSATCGLLALGGFVLSLQELASVRFVGLAVVLPALLCLALGWMARRHSR
jgi:hypothetical protein